MQSNDPSQILSQEQIADAVNRAKIGSQRQKNEMMRLGTSDPTSFQMNFSKQLQDQAAPQEFWGAGRKLASNQTPDQETSDFAGAALPTLGGQRYYYGDTDYSVPENVQSSILKAGWTQAGNNFDSSIANILGTKVVNYKGQNYYQGQDPSTVQWGTQGYTQQDIGGGKYNILDQSGNNLGIGYKSLDDTIKDFTSKYNKEHPIYTPLFPQNEDLSNTTQSLLNYNPNLISGGDLEKWEILGQLLNGKPFTQNNSTRYLPGNNQEESIKGLNTLFGSIPLINNGKVAGYKFDTTPIDNTILGYQHPNLVSRIDNEGSTRYNQSLLRDYNDLDTWNKLTHSIDENNMYVPAENAEQLPGWTNKDINLYSHKGNSLGSNLVKGLGAVLSFTPLAPLGLAMSTIASLSSGNHLGGILGAIIGGSGIAGPAGDSIGKATGLGSQAGSYIAKGGLGALSALGNGAKGSSALLSGLGSGLGAFGGNEVSSTFGDALGKTGSKIFGDSVSGAIQSLFNKTNPISGAATNGLSSGLGSFLSSMINTGENMDTKRQKPYDALGKTIVNLANYQRMRKR